MVGLVQKLEFRVVAVAALLALTACGDSERLPASPGAAAVTDKTIPITTTSIDAQTNYLEAAALIDALHFTEAREFLERALELDPDFALAHLLKARTAESPSEFFAGLENAERVIDEVSLGEQLLIRAFRASTQGDAEQQLGLLRKLVALYPSDETAHMRLGNFFVLEQQYQKAVEQFEHAIQLNTEFAPAYNMLGYAYRGLEDFDSARRAFQSYVELVPDEPNPYDSYAELLMEAGDYDASIATYRKALDIAPDFLPSLAGISINEALKGNPQGAIEAASEMLARSRNLPERRMATTRLVGAHLHASDFDAALKAIDQLADAGSEANNALLVADAEEFAADILLLKGDSEAAMNLYQSALDRRSNSDLELPAKLEARRQFLYKATLSALQSGAVREAHELVARYRSEARSGGNARERQRVNELEGYSALLREDYDKAIERLGSANPMSPVVNYFIAMAYREAGDLAAARKHAHIAAYRNTLAPSLPYFRKQALAMIETLDEEMSGTM